MELPSPLDPWFEHSPAAHWLLDQDLRVVTVNRAMRELLGPTEGDWIVRPLTAILIGLDGGLGPTADQLEGTWLVAPASRSDIQVPLAVEHRVTPVEGGFIGTLRDVKDEEGVRHALSVLETSFRAMAENVPGALFRYRIHPDGRDSVSYLSPGCFDICEMPAEGLQEDASLLWDMILDEDRDATRQTVLDSAEHLTPWFCRWRIRTPSGVVKWLQGAGRPERSEDGTLEWNSFILDISETQRAQQRQQRLERQLRSSRHLESLGRLAGGVAHDFNNLLTVIVGCVEAAQEQLHDPEELKELLEEIGHAADRSASLTRQLLSFASQRKTEPRPIRLGVHVKALLRLLSRLVGEHITIETSIADAWATVFIEPAALDQIVTNLVANARDAMPNGGTLTLTTRTHEDANGQRWAILDVEDTGQGIPLHVQDRIFEPFFTTKEGTGRGFGLGLATVHGNALAAGGCVDVESALGKGTRLSVWLPLHDAEVPADGSEVAARPTPVTREPSVLIVDPDGPLRRMLNRGLTKAGYRCAMAGTPSEALGLAHAEGPFDRVLCEILLPEMNGPTFVARLREIQPDVAVIYMASWIPIDAAPVEPDATILPKPFGMNEALRHLRGGSD